MLDQRKAACTSENDLKPDESALNLQRARRAIQSLAECRIVSNGCFQQQEKWSGVHSCVCQTQNISTLIRGAVISAGSCQSRPSGNRSETGTGSACCFRHLWHSTLCTDELNLSYLSGNQGQQSVSYARHHCLELSGTKNSWLKPLPNTRV